MALRLRTDREWAQFLKDAGIPETEALAYAKIFTNNRITEITLPDLTMDILKSLEITVLGDILSILRHTNRATDTSNQTPPEITYRPPTALLRNSQL